MIKRSSQQLESVDFTCHCHIIPKNQMHFRKVFSGKDVVFIVISDGARLMLFLFLATEDLPFSSLESP